MQIAKLNEIASREIKDKTLRVFALLPERDELCKSLNIKETITLIKTYNDILFAEKQKNEVFEW